MTGRIITAALAIGLASQAQAQAPLAAQGCVGCHGTAGIGSPPIPALAGRPAADIASQMRSFRANERPGTIMGRIARGYTDAEIDQSAAYYAALPGSAQ